MLSIQRLQTDASTVESLSHANRLRDALLAAVSHDLRTPLASIKALTSGWLEPGVEWLRTDVDGFMRTIDAEADRLHKLVENLLDMSRLQSGALELARRPTGLDEIVPAALATLSTRTDDVAVDVAESLPLVDVDPALLDTRSPTSSTTRCATRAVMVQCWSKRAVADRVDVPVPVDRGCGIPLAGTRGCSSPSNAGRQRQRDRRGPWPCGRERFVEAIGGELPSKTRRAAA